MAVVADQLSDGYSGKSVLVTGGAGFIGSRLSQHLADLGAHVASVSRSDQEVHKNTNVRALACDLSDFDQTDEMLNEVKPDIVFHLASHVVGKREREVVRSTLSSNLVSTVNLLCGLDPQVCQRIVLTGSLEEPTPDGEWAVPSSPYAASKLAAGDYGRMFNALYGLSVVNLRVFMVYGPGQMDLKKLVPYVITSLLKGDRPSFSSGTRKIDWIYVDDVVKAYLLAGIRDEIDGKTIDVGSGKLHSVREVVSELFRLMGQIDPPEFGGVEDRALEQVRRADTQRSFENLAWRAETELSDGLQATIEWYTRNIQQSTF